MTRGSPSYRVELATNTSIASVISSRLGVPKCMTVMHTIYSHTRRHSDRLGFSFATGGRMLAQFT